ncbi:hypothetical protein [Bradyrhizobium elkanii]|uniref:hypothetical protein n=1 Tax=Bradyrhizobium elkanii TaxID=29448 RepID=UPI00272D2C1A|nr:hypothetical protein [Bradyrhizobium elkanii]WLA85307.1 hypothetical protein QNJ99_14400 [Bradyrhizobium elkanii]
MAGTKSRPFCFVAQFVGWVERSDTHQLPLRGEMMGIAALHPSYAPESYGARNTLFTIRVDRMFSFHAPRIYQLSRCIGQALLQRLSVAREQRRLTPRQPKRFSNEKGRIARMYRVRLHSVSVA